MTASVEASSMDSHADPTPNSRLVVAWQHPVTRLISPVGFLDAAGSRYRFTYIRRALAVDGFRPLMGFPNFEETYESSQLFPLFAQRVMSARRPEFKSFLAELDLAGAEGLTPMEILGRSGGRRVGDTLQLVPVPFADNAGNTSCQFLIHGIRYRLEEQPSLEDTLGGLRAGDRLQLRDQPDNPANEHAIIALCEKGMQIGWVPDLLLDYVHAVRQTGEPAVSVLHVNGQTSPPHLRVLAELRGRVNEAYRPFSGPDWQIPRAEDFPVAV